MQCPQLAGTDLDVSVLCFGPMRSAAWEPGDDTLSRPCLVGLNTIEQVDGLVAAAADIKIDAALVEDVHALWENE